LTLPGNSRNKTVVTCFTPRLLLPALLLAAGGALAATNKSASPPRKLADYRVGEIAQSNIIATVELVVVDREASAALREKEALKVPAIAVFNPNATDEAVAALRDTFSRTRAEFLSELEKTFGRQKLGAQRLTTPMWRRFYTGFAAAHKPFPLTPALAQQWAQGQSGADTESLWVNRVRAAIVDRYIRPDEVPAEVRAGPPLVRMVSVPARGPAPDLALVDQMSIGVPRTNLLAVGRVRQEFQRNLPEEERALGRFLQGFIQPNCHYDTALTARNRALRTEAIWTAERYPAGMAIVRAGEPITPRVRAALDELIARTAVLALREREQSMPDPWLWVGLTAGTCVLLAALGGQLIRRRGPRLAPAGPYLTGEVIPAGLPAAPGMAALPDTAGGATAATPQETAWRERARAAEERAARSQDALRESLKPGLLRLLRDKFIRALLQERQSSQETLRLAEAGLAELEARLERLHAPLAERLDAYERRISELEQELKARGAENRELIEATIALAKQRLEAERAGKRVTLN
jgi:hypothetical protein